MKKIILIIPLLFLFLPIMAQYDTYSSNSGLSIMTILYSVMLIVVYVLQIILFFKIWRMANDVNALKTSTNLPDCEKSTSYNLRIHRAILCGDKKEAQKLIINKHLYRLNPYDSSVYYDINSFRKEYALTGEELPVIFTCIEKYYDYKRLFQSETNDKIENNDIVKRNSDGQLMRFRYMMDNKYICYICGDEQKLSYDITEITKVNPIELILNNYKDQ